MDGSVIYRNLKLEGGGIDKCLRGCKDANSRNLNLKL